jgi:hypothetical protein
MPAITAVRPLPVPRIICNRVIRSAAGSRFRTEPTRQAARYNRINRGNAEMARNQDEERAERPDTKPQDQSGPHHVADEPVADADPLGATVQKPTTETGLSVEEQVRKEWDPKKDGGLPVPLHNEVR